ncbi:MAG: peptidylprolyl isomerase [Verrucomicrobia bacterium]|nr:peptidylprolyl isomerase [Verrucomicrobiota bacterium]
MKPAVRICGLAAIALYISASLVASAAEPAKRKGPTKADVLAVSKPSDWRGLDPENTLYVEFASGRVVIELAPAFAPRHVANVKALARERYYDGLAVIRAQDNYVVQWGDPDAEKPASARKIQHAQRTLPAEFERTFDPKLPFTRLPDGDVYAREVGFSGGFPVARDRRSGKMWLVHGYGMVGAGRDNSPDSGGGTELYVVGPINAIRVAADVPESERSALEIMRTDTPAFQELIESRRNRREEWFQVPAGRIELGNVLIPVRLKNGGAR